jgi:hypothetical protein
MAASGRETLNSTVRGNGVEPGGTFDYTDAEMWGFCLRRLIEERADNMEYVIKEKQIQGKKSDRKHLLKYLNGRLLERPSLD